MSVERPSSAVGRLFRFLVFRLIPLALIILIIVVGANVVQSLMRVASQQASAQSRLSAYAETATAIAPTATISPVTNGASKVLPKFALAERVLRQDFVTNTPPPLPTPTLVLPVTNTPAASATPSATPTMAATEGPAVTATPRPLPTLLMPGNVEPRIAPPTAVPSQVPALDRRGQDILNILLLGNDGELTDDGFIRTDTMIVVSINRTAGTVGMLSLPRDLYVYMPGWTMQRLNVAYTYGESAGWTDGGFGLMRETLFYNFGLNVHYYAMVDLSGFKEIVDAVGGVDLAVDCALQDYPLIGAEVPAGAIEDPGEDNLVTLPVGYYHMSGAEALWYARSRGNSSDFDRGRRQQQVLRAIWRKARDSGELANLPQLWNQGMNLVQTNLPLEVAIDLLPIALNLDTSRMEQFTLRRLYDTTPWQTPDGDYVQLPNYEHILELLNDLYVPPTQSQIVQEGARIAVYNGTSNADWDKVAAERLAWDGFSAVAAGPAPTTDVTDTILIDYTGATKGSSLNDVARILNVRPENIRLEPNPSREYDFEVILGRNYNSCTFNVLPVAGEG